MSITFVCVDCGAVCEPRQLSSYSKRCAHTRNPQSAIHRLLTRPHDLVCWECDLDDRQAEPLPEAHPYEERYSGVVLTQVERDWLTNNF